jgi:hypothetical protein
LENNWWFVPEILGDELNKLRPLPDEPINGSVEIKKASALTIYLHSVYVATSNDPKGTVKKRPGNFNDLFISSNHKTGSTPKVQRIHYYKDKEPINKLYSNFFDSVIYSTKDFKYDIFHLNIQVYDIDNYDKYKEVLSAISGMGNSLAVNFPALSQITAIAIPGANGILNLIDKINEHDKIIDDTLRLEIAQPNIGTVILQTGNFIYFNQPQKEGLKFDSTKRVVNENGDSFTGCDYAVVSIRNTEIEEINKWEKDQKAAKLMSELQGKGTSGKAAVEFVKDTVEGYNNYRNLQRITELEKKLNPTPEEIALLSKLKQDPALLPYLPKTT